MGIQDWTAKDIEKARNFFLNGYSIKEIAREIGRSSTATNKALSRFGIRIKRKAKIYEGSITPKKKMQYQEKAIAAPSFENAALRGYFDNWISFWQLCEFLSNNNIRIFELTSAKTDLENKQFQVGSKILNAAQLLLVANKIRTQNNQKAFLVRDLSW